MTCASHQTDHFSLLYRLSLMGNKGITYYMVVMGVKRIEWLYLKVKLQELAVCKADVMSAYNLIIHQRCTRFEKDKQLECLSL